MKKLVFLLLSLSFLVSFGLSSSFADGCYICSGKSGTYVKFKGSDTWDKRKKAKACGCEVGGTTSSCYASNYTILCTVAFNEKGESTLVCKKDK